MRHPRYPCTSSSIVVDYAGNVNIIGFVLGRPLGLNALCADFLGTLIRDDPEAHVINGLLDTQRPSQARSVRSSIETTFTDTEYQIAV
jgi:hypothetical protein